MQESPSESNCGRGLYREALASGSKRTDFAIVAYVGKHVVIVKGGGRGCADERAMELARDLATSCRYAAMNQLHAAIILLCDVISDVM